MKKTIMMCALFGLLLFAAAGCSDVPNDPVPAEPHNEVITETVSDSDSPTVQEVSESDSLTEQEETDDFALTEPAENDIFKDSGIARFRITSEDLHDGVWDSIITNTANGSNVSPQLSWEPVPDAECYVIFMVDTSAGNWLHWKSDNVTDTVLPQGWASEDEFIGPYPPSGTHSYEVYVIALRQSVERVKGAFNAYCPKFANIAMALDSVEEGSSGNILAYGHLPGTYTHGD